MNNECFSINAQRNLLFVLTHLKDPVTEARISSVHNNNYSSSSDSMSSPPAAHYLLTNSVSGQLSLCTPRLINSSIVSPNICSNTKFCEDSKGRDASVGPKNQSTRHGVTYLRSTVRELCFFFFISHLQGCPKPNGRVGDKKIHHRLRHERVQLILQLSCESPPHRHV